jgi:predicted nucleic acid-binding protein
MIYFDSDVWVHYFFFQDPAKQALAVQKIQSAATLNQVAASVLCLQEVSFVLSKLGASKTNINQALTFLKAFAPIPLTLPSFQKAEIFAQSIGFQNINDCIHTAIAEVNCTELVTFNHSDFKRLQPLTNLKITLL